MPHVLPPFPGDLEQLTAPGWLDSLSAVELGACYRLLKFAWGMGCSLPDDNSSLAAVARVTVEDFTLMRQRVILALAGTHPANGANFVLEVSLRVQQSLVAASERNRQKTAAATQAAAAKRNGASVTDPSRIRDGHVTDPSRSFGSTARSSAQSFVLAPPLMRPKEQSAIQSAPMQSAQEGDVIAQLGAGAGAILKDRVVTWRRQKSLGMLQMAIAKWATAGVTNCPIGKASELAECEHAEPARVDYLIEEAQGGLARAAANGGTFNPVGFLISGLGESAKTKGRPKEIPMFVAERWAKKQADVLCLLKAEAAIAARKSSLSTSLSKEA
jgi:uncharacterized protein YdaU (DUF1376 family)